jgi:hypothetical protein
MLTNAVREQMTELHWLVGELGLELEAMATTSYPRVHCFLMRNLAARIARVAVQVGSSVTEQPPGERTPSDGVHLLEHSA